VTLILNGTDNSATTPAVTGTDTDTGVYYPAANQVAIATSGTQAMLANASQGVQFANAIGVGATTPTTSGAGITFPATQSASSDANTLDDYEEGTWTPGWSVSGGTIVSKNLDSGFVPGGTYTKIGNTVYIRGYISYGSQTGSPSGALAISGLPFTPGAGYGQSQTFAGGVTVLSMGLWLSGAPQFAQVVPGSTTTNSLGYKNAGGTGGSATTFADMNTSSNHSQFVFQGQYTV
jgi:hypothetical protein